MTPPAPTPPGPDDPSDEARALALLHEADDAIVEAVEREVPGWVERGVARILDAWGEIDGPGGLDPDARARADRDAVTAGEAARTRVVAELRALFAVDPEQQRATPLQVVRTAHREPTALLASLGVPHVVRDEFDERSFPDDVYGLTPHTLGDLGDRDLGPLHLAWGMAKTRVVKARRGL
jgi:hypothetical protein